MSQADDTIVPGVPVAAGRPRLSRRALMLALVLAVVIVAVVLVATGVFSSSGPSGGSLDNAYPTGVTHVTRQSLTQQTEVSATLTYAGSATVVVPAGTPTSAVTQAQQAVTSAQAMLETASATLSADSQSLSQLQSSLDAARAKEGVDCAGTNAAQSAASSPAASGSSGAGSTPCATDGQTVSTDEQSLTTTQTKVATDRMQVSSNETALSGDETSLNAAAATAAVYGQTSTYTTLPALGAIIRRGQSLYSISGTPVVLLYGSVAPWRAFVAGMSPGPDVRELNANLEALGDGKGLRGDAFTSSTEEAIKAFQSARGMSPTGELPLGSVVFQPGAARVTAVTPTLGATVAPGPVLSITQTVRQVQIQLDAAEQSDVKVGDPVTITLPDNSTTPGRVSYVGTVATTPSANGNNGNGGSSSPTIEVNVTPTDPAATGNLDQAPVNVSIVTASVSNALVVPVDALLALSNGGYALEEIGAGGVHHLVAVNLGLFDDADGEVQVTGAGVAPGQRVVIPQI